MDVRLIALATLACWTIGSTAQQMPSRRQQPISIESARKLGKLPNSRLQPLPMPTLDQLKMNPEFTIARECAETFGVTKAGVACTVGSLSVSEFQKCLDHGVGTAEGCLGPNNDLVKLTRNPPAYAEQVIRNTFESLGAATEDAKKQFTEPFKQYLGVSF